VRREGGGRVENGSVAKEEALYRSCKRSPGTDCLGRKGILFYSREKRRRLAVLKKFIDTEG